MERSMFTTLCGLCDELETYVRDLAPGPAPDHLAGLVRRLDEAIERTASLQQERIAWTEALWAIIEDAEAGHSSKELIERLKALWSVQALTLPLAAFMDPRRPLSAPRGHTDI